MLLPLILQAGAATAAAVSSRAPPTVTLDSATVTGAASENVSKFLGIPFGQPPCVCLLLPLNYRPLIIAVVLAIFDFSFRWPWARIRGPLTRLRSDRRVPSRLSSSQFSLGFLKRPLTTWSILSSVLSCPQMKIVSISCSVIKEFD